MSNRLTIHNGAIVSGSLNVLSGSGIALNVNNNLFVSTSFVGVGTASPGYPLDVTVKGFFRGDLSLGPGGSDEYFQLKSNAAEGASAMLLYRRAMYIEDGAGAAIVINPGVPPQSTSIQSIVISSIMEKPLCIQGNGRETVFGLNTATPTPSSLVRFESTTKGFLLTRMTGTQRNLMTASQGLMTYVTSNNEEGLWYYNSGSYQSWTRVLNSSGSQSISGSLTISNILTLPYQDPLPASPATGSIALSGSGATFVGMFVWTGVWTQI